ncbi:membrane protein [Caldovatus sediminis]|uniref:Membrane protein n=1 Tax=Caldovatus sediminis TaxID=2041189 RepID=A0A8J3EET4_9PROT|nr:OmpA family protein [Caldovatus sediminis]GGG45206.1 membrane protein [Caldovatus sediminis]
MSLRKALLAATVVSLPMAAQAQPVTGLYLGAGAGVNWLQESSDTVPTAPGFPGVTGEIETNTGWGGVLSLGWGFGNGLRAEIEGNFRSNDVDSVRVGAAGIGSARLPNSGGRVRSYGVMGNVLYDIGAVQRWPVHVTLGAGVGYVWHDYDAVGGALVDPVTGDRVGVRIDDTDGRFAYQAIAGVSVPIAAVPGLAVTAEYRFLGTLSPELRGRVTASGPTVQQELGVSPVASSFRYDADNFNHSIFVGLRYNFGQVAPPPPPAPAVAPVAPAPRTFLVFFDWDRADLTARARQIVAEAAQAARTQQVTRIEVAGHADRSGSAQYNQRLSQRRADNVAAELVRNGVPREQIVVTAYGETRPLVPTADGVREPQNRRVEIVLR